MSAGSNDGACNYRRCGSAVDYESSPGGESGGLGAAQATAVCPMRPYVHVRAIAGCASHPA